MKSKRFCNLIKQTVRKLRKEQTESEAILWRALRNRKLLGKKFLRQYPIVFNWEGIKRFFIADFYCHDARLAVELDGAVHLQRKDYDEARDYVLKSIGIRVIRIKNGDIANNTQNIIDSIKKELRYSSKVFPSLTKRGELKG